MNGGWNKEFFRFFFGFVAIIALAFAVMLWAGYMLNSTPPPVDNTAVPR